jgi:acid phosphatase type 7
MTKRFIGHSCFVAALLVTLFLSTGLYSAFPQDTLETDSITIAAAGDIASCESDGDEKTASLLDDIDPEAVLTLGDNVYEDGSAEQFRDCYEPSWGRYKDITYPSIGNHDYGAEGYEGMEDGEYNPSPYFDYFGDRAGEQGKGWYSYDLGDWHLVVLDSDCDNGVECDPYSEQIQWLKEDLAKTSSECILAYWHHPLYSSGYHGPDPKMRAAWNILYGYGADVVLNGHDHDYESWKNLDPYGNPDENGIKEFVVGTGGKSARTGRKHQPNSANLLEGEFGVLRLDLTSSGYDWHFIKTDGTIGDSGSGECH